MADARVQRYLDRIGHDGPLAPTLETLIALQREHMLAVPFENLDIHRGRRLVIDPVANVDKIVDRHRGGWCFELNGAFGWLLARLGFRVTLLGSRVHGTDWVSQDLAHLLLLVDVDRPHLVDVGFGDGPLHPVPLADVPDRVMHHPDGLSVEFAPEPRGIEEFDGMSAYLQTSPDSGFVRTRVCVRALPDGGRLRLRELVLVERHGAREAARDLKDEDEWAAVVRERFGIDPDR